MTKTFLSSNFKMKDFGKVDIILGIKVRQTSGGFCLSQTHYIEKMLNKFSHLNIKEAKTPINPCIKLEPNMSRSAAQLEYASTIGSAMYAIYCTRPDIAYTVSKLSQFTNNPSNDHWRAIERLFGYLKGTKDLSLHYSEFPSVLEGYTDASWISSVGDNKSTTGWIFTLGGGAVS